ncbi:type II toxin-antitoxin system PemK/MazF family toxin [Burkholderia pyrrocinia]|uniref:type II toxin-antitoxin system PemK/MazF family toxin n=1 Tax=Burkholderia pyrrocinia TaxID=60550 RepID=UPI00158DD0C5|nr:type II toxin-antitoxin system PemK/MazF family toxin [Burkholderia pyrrocinia]
MVIRGEIWLVALDPRLSNEVQTARPCIIVSPPELNDHLRTVIVAPMSSKDRPTPFRVPVTFKRKHGLILLDQVRTVDKVRLVKREGVVAEQTLLATLRILQNVFAE